MFIENIIAKYGIRKTLSFGTNNLKLKKKKKKHIKIQNIKKKKKTPKKLIKPVKK